MTDESFLNKYLAQNLRLLFFTVIVLIVLLPVSFHYTDRGLDILIVDKLEQGNHDLKSSNVIITGKLLFSKSLVEYKNEKIEKVICPMLSLNAKDPSRISCFFVWENEYEKDTTYRALFHTGSENRRDTIVAIRGIARTFLYEPYSEDVTNYEKKRFKEEFGLSFDYFPLVILVDSKFSLAGYWILFTILLFLVVYLVYNYKKLLDNPNQTTNPIEQVL